MTFKISNFVRNRKAMNLQAAKLDVVRKLLNVQRGALLEKISNLLDKEMIVAYTVEGKPLTKGAYNNRLQKAEQQIKSGDYLTHEALEKESENW